MTAFVFILICITLLHLLSVLFGLAVSSGATLTSQFVPLEEWTAQTGDRFIVDTQDNIGYIAREDGLYTSFPVGSGQRRVVHYIGKTYNATTPPARWSIGAMDKKTGDRATYGNTGRFLRLYHERWGRTSYGIHSTSNIDEILSSTSRFRSMGCILVSDRILDILETTYYLNGQTLDVVTTYGLNEQLLEIMPPNP